MKTRIISGVVAIIIVVAALIVNSYYPITIVIALSILSALASYEMLHNTGCVKRMTPVVAAMIYSAAVQFSYKGLFLDVELITVFYALFVVLLALFRHKTFGAEQIIMSLSMPVILSYGFSTFERILNFSDGHGLFYFILLFNFSSISDCCAYFVGVAIGKHKLAPVISPKKTIEGSVGGVAGSLIGTLVICLIFNKITGYTANLWLLLAATPFFSVVGMMGDLFMSAIKRDFGIKDYGKLIPGHGGVLDRLDSLLLVAPVMSLLLTNAEVVL